MPQPGFFDLDETYSKLDGLGDPLVKIVGWSAGRVSGRFWTVR